ncbi:MAG: group II intron reverse transcriptase/maturase [Verrucomicrobia bacterium]|nr:group II intron reverse transcriptase/maturase [Verrucomicrobiota bacterium]
MKTEALLERWRSPRTDGPRSEESAPGLAAVASEANLLQAWERVRRNDGAPGVDAVTIADLEPQFPGLAQGIADALLNGEYRPKPVRRVEVPKSSGGTRKLGVPTVIDRVVHQAIVQVLQPVFEPLFSPHSFAYRPGRGPLDAVQYIQRRLSPTAGWVLHFDVEDFFDSVSHDRVLTVLSRQVTDGALLELIRATLHCGVFQDGRILPTVQGIAQGSPLSPLLANAVLDSLDQWLDARGAIFARYADDGALLVDSGAEGERFKSELSGFLSSLALRLNEKKTILTPADQAEFLGFGFRSGPRGRCLRIISPASLEDFRRTLGEILSEKGTAALEERIASVTTLLNSWLGYYGATEEPCQIEETLAQAEDQLRLSEWRRWLNPGARERGLSARGVQLDLAKRAAAAQGDDSVVLESLRQAFPSEWLRDQGLEFTSAMKARLPRSMDYSGRLRAEPKMGSVVLADWSPEWLGEWSWCVLNSRWLGVNVHFGRRPAAWLPRIVSVSFEVREHRLVIHR